MTGPKGWSAEFKFGNFSITNLFFSCAHPTITPIWHTNDLNLYTHHIHSSGHYDAEVSQSLVYMCIPVLRMVHNQLAPNRHTPNRLNPSRHTPKRLVPNRHIHRIVTRPINAPIKAYTDTMRHNVAYNDTWGLSVSSVYSSTTEGVQSTLSLLVPGKYGLGFSCVLASRDTCNDTIYLLV
mgnify:CR=1 FL=1